MYDNEKFCFEQVVLGDLVQYLPIKDIGIVIRKDVSFGIVTILWAASNQGQSISGVDFDNFIVRQLIFLK